jgi:hypothetical protein
MNTAHLSLDRELEKISVFEPYEHGQDTPQSIDDWWAVADDDGIIAYFNSESEAFRYRLNLVNRKLNP